MTTGCCTGQIAMRDFGVVEQRCQERLQRLESGSAAVRLFHGRGHCYPGFSDLTVDYYAGHLLVGSFGDDPAGAQSLAARLSQLLPGIRAVSVQRRQGRGSQAVQVVGTMPREIEVMEGNLKFLVRPLLNQNVGLFLDMAPTRSWLQARAGNKRVLNLFAYTCAFSVAALAGGADLVVNNDMSRTALDWGRDNHRCNGQDLRDVRMLPHNLFKSWWKIRQLGPYDIVIIDPPTNQRGSFVAEKHYGSVLKRLPELCAPGALVVACLNSPFLNTDFLPQQAARWAPGCRLLEPLPIAEDFPDEFPDRGLKISLFSYQQG